MQILKMNALQTQLHLQKIVGAEFVTKAKENWLSKLGLEKENALLVEPGNEQETAEVLQFANKQGISVIPVGNGQQLHIGTNTNSAEILLRSNRMTGIVEHSAGDLTLSVKAGTPFSEVQDFLAAYGQFVPVLPPTAGNSTIGGLVATAACGPERVLYGSWRDIVIGLKVNYPNGQILRTGGKVVKNVAGYDMNKLFIGSYGTLAFLSEITLKLRPLPKYRQLVIAESENRSELIELASRILASECVVSSLELIRQKEKRTATYQLAVGSDEVESASKYQLERIRQMVAGTGIKLSILLAGEVENFWMNYRKQWSKTSAGRLVMQAGIPIPQMDEILSRYEEQAFKGNQLLEYTASLGVGTLRIHLLGENTTGLIENASIYRILAEEKGGYLVVEYGEPDLKNNLDVWGTIPTGLHLMKGVKQTIDPVGIFNPGRFVGGI